MRNPFRSEAEAFRFVWLTIGYFALIVIASLVNRWLGVAVFLVLSGVVAWWLFSHGDEKETTRHAPAPSPEDEHRILVAANETVGGLELLTEIRERAGDRRARILVVCPALNSPLRHWANDEDQARDEAQRRLERSVESMRATGLEVEGEVGDGDPIQAIEDAVRTFQPDELIISTHPPGRSHWLERGVVERARSRFDLPLIHVVVDLDADGDDSLPR
jgi:GABA permease